MDFGVPINPSQGGQAWTEMLQGAIAGAQHPALRTGSMPYECIVPTFMPDRIAVVSIQGREAVNELYEYDVQVVSPFPPEIIQPAIFGANAKLVMHTPEHDARIVDGVVVALACLGVADRGLGKGLFQYEMTIAPPMWLWTQRERNRVFQNQTVIEVATSMLKADKIHHRFDLDDKEYPKRALYYQRDETDLDFFKRILADAGIYFLFNHAVHDDTTGGVMSDVATGGVALGVTGGAVSPFAKSTGDRISNAGGTIEEVTKGVTILVLSDDARGVVPLHDFSAVTELGDQIVKKALGTASQAIAAATGDKVKASAGLDASDPINVDDGYGGPGDELLFDVELRRVVRPKSTWMLERDRRAPQSWAHVQRNDPADAQFDLDVHLRFSEQGVGVDGGAKIKMDIDAPWIPAGSLEKELIQRSSVWPQYPSESRPKKKDGGGVFDTHKHLKYPLEQLRRDAQTATVTTSCRRLGAGYRFIVAQHPSVAFNVELAVLSLTVDAIDPEMLQLDPKDPRTKRPFIATLQCAPADDYAPRPPIPQRRKFPMELATVIRWQESMDMVSEARNEVYVRLDWDVERDVDNKTWFARGNDKEYPLSTNRDGERDRVLRVPIVQPWAGNGYGMQVVPREGMQVLIGYIDSQGDRPVLLGCLHTDKNPPPWASGYEANRVGFRTQSQCEHGLRSDDQRSDGISDGYSEISVDDTAREESLRLRAQKDMFLHVLGDRDEQIDSNTSLSVKGNATTRIEGALISHVLSDATVAVGGASSDAVDGDRFELTKGDSYEIVHGSRFLGISKDWTTNVSGSEQSTVHGDRTIITHGSHRLLVGERGENAAFEEHIEGNATTSATGDLVFRADKRIAFLCGKTRIDISPDGLTIDGKTVVFSATEKATIAGKSATIELDANLEAFAKEVHLNSGGASLDLTSDAKIQAGSIALGSGGGKSKSANNDESKAGTVPLKICILDHNLKPLANKKGLLFAKGERLAVTTDGDGNVTADLSADIAQVVLRIWTDKYPDGPYRDHIIQIHAALDADPTRAMLTRLSNLGFYSGPISDDLTQARRAVSLFQRAHAKDGLTATGELDEATKAKLKELHKS